MVFYTTVEAMYFILLLNLENKANLKTTSETVTDVENKHGYEGWGEAGWGRDKLGGWD